MVAQNIAFGVTGAAMVLAALRLVTTRNVVRAALFLAVVLAGAAAQFILLAADFVAVVQVLVYIGAIVVLFLFGIMLTRAPIGASQDLDNDQRWLAAIVALFVLGVLGAILLDAFPFGDATEIGTAGLAATAGRTTGPLGEAIFRQYVVPFEVISVLLLAALVGAIVIARRD
jgi:NADH-quinone oxidoreductase subunit J